MTTATTATVSAARPVTGTLFLRYSSRIATHLVLVVLAVVWLTPTAGLLVTSFRPLEAISDSGWWTALSPARFTLDSYATVLTARGMGRSFLNSFIITIPSTVLPVFIAALAGFAFAWIQFRARDTILLVIIALLTVPIQMILVPNLQLYSRLGITGSFVGLWLVHTAFGTPFGIYLLRNFFVQLPRDLFESARIDGASELTIFFRIVLPLSTPALASLAIFQFMWVWNDLLMALVFLSNPGRQPMTVAISGMIGTYGTEWHLLSAAAFLSMSVPLVVFFALQRYFVRGLMAGSVKG
ncbi:MAG: carbohydrate ABC transporter permease [Deinococcus sp.]|nr:carbohydrate ABC transporter permease [Deinococcus sp.]